MKIKKYNNFFLLKKKWKKLYDNNYELSPYQSNEYAKVAFSYYFPYAVKLKVIPVFFEILDNDIPIMIIPLCKKIFNNEYILFGYKSGYGYLDFIYRKDIGKDKMEECFGRLSQELKGSKLRINRIRENSLLCQYLLQKYESRATESCVCIDLMNSYDTYYASLSKNTRQNIRTAYNRLQKEQKVVSLKIFYKQPLTGKELSEVTDLYVTRRKSRYELSGGMLIKLFLKNLDIGSVAMKKLDNYVHFILYIDDCAVAFYNGFLSRDDGTITVPRLAIRNEYAKFSPGILLLNESVKKICELGIANKIDLMQGNEKYKYSMGGETHYCYQFDLLF